MENGGHGCSLRARKPVDYARAGPQAREPVRQNDIMRKGFIYIYTIMYSIYNE